MPTEFVKRQVFFTFEVEEEGGFRRAPEVGLDNFLWASDFPGLDSPWPHSKAMGHAPAEAALGKEALNQLVFENAVKPVQDSGRPAAVGWPSACSISALFGDMFGTAAMRAVFGDMAFLARCAEVEAALARAQARLGIVPAEAAAAITRAAKTLGEYPEALDLARLKRETETVGYPILPLVRQLAERAGEAGRWLHWGATTQDIMDSAAVCRSAPVST